MCGGAPEHGNGQNDPTADAVQLAGTPLSFTLLAGDATVPYIMGSGMTDRVRVVVRDQATLDALWHEAYGNSSVYPAVPVIDFSTTTVVVASRGRPSGGSIQVDAASIDNWA